MSLVTSDTAIRSIPCSSSTSTFSYATLGCNTHSTVQSMGSTLQSLSCGQQQQPRPSCSTNYPGIPSNLYVNGKGTNTVASQLNQAGSCSRPWDNHSDRLVPSYQPIQSSRTQLKHCSAYASPGGIGCDVKHGSYDRYLRKLKGHAQRSVCC